MSIPCSIFFVFVFLFFLQFCPTLSEIQIMEVLSDTRSIITFNSFGFTTAGRLELNVTNLAVSPPGADLTRAGFFLCPPESCLLLPGCLLDSHSVSIVARLLVGVSAFRVSFDVKSTNRFTLGFANCHSPLLAVTMNVSSAMFNLDGENPSLRNYLSAGSSFLPKIYFHFFLAHTFLAGIWVVVLCRKGIAAFRIHYFMLGLLVLNALHLLFESEDTASIDRTGSAQGSWDVLAYVFNFLKSIATFTLIVLVGAGWLVFKLHLHSKEQMVLMMVISLQVFTNLAQIAMDKKVQFAKNRTAWNEIFLLVDVVCCTVAIFPTVWSIKSLRIDGKAAAGNILKRNMYRRYHVLVFEFLVAVVLYIVFTRVIVYAMLCKVPFQFSWAGVAAAELATLVFYVFTGYKFRPRRQKAYLLADAEEEEAADEASQSKETCPVVGQDEHLWSYGL